MNKKITEARVSYATFSYTQNGSEGGNFSKTFHIV